MAEKKRDWYSKKKGKGEKEDARPESMHERHTRERGETHQRHSKARDDMHKQHEEEMEAMAARHAAEAELGPDGGTPGAEPAPAPMNTAGAGVAAGTPAAVSGANAA